MIVVAVVGFVVVSANEGTSAQPYAGAQFQGGGYCETPMGSQLPMHGGQRVAGRGRGAGRGSWMSGPVAQIAGGQACSDCNSGARVVESEAPRRRVAPRKVLPRVPVVVTQAVAAAPPRAAPAAVVDKARLEAEGRCAVRM